MAPGLVAPDAFAVSATIPTKRFVAFLTAGMGTRSALTPVNYIAPFFGWLVQGLQWPHVNALSVCRAYKTNGKRGR